MKKIALNSLFFQKIPKKFIFMIEYSSYKSGCIGNHKPQNPEDAGTISMSVYKK